MLAQAVKKFRWHFSDGAFRTFLADAHINGTPEEIESMVEGGYAIRCRPSRKDFYRKSFSLNGLKAFCGRHGIILKSTQRNVSDVIEAILKHEKQHGKIEDWYAKCREWL